MEPHSKDYVLGIDIGTGSCKAVAVGLTGKKLAVSKFFYTTQSPEPGYVEQDPEAIWKGFTECCKEVVTKISFDPVAISFSSAMHSVMLINEDNKPLTPLIIWADKRSEKIAEDLKGSPEGKKIYNATGTPIFSMSPLSKIMWFKKNEPSLFEKASKFVSIKEFIWHRLFNEWQVDLSIASATGLLDIQSYNWHQPSLDLCGINSLRLSNLVATSYLRSDANKNHLQSLGLKNNPSFCIGASDGCLANLGSFALEPGVGALTIGTSGAIRIATPKPLNNYASMLFNYILEDDIYISGGPINNGGIVIKWLLKIFMNTENPQREDYKKMFTMIQDTPPGSEGLIFLPYLLGERAPVWDANASGLFFGIKNMHEQKHFLRAGIEGICFALKSILEDLEEIVANINQLNISGGFVNSPEWIQILSDITGKKLCITEIKDASSTGAAMLAMKKLNLIEEYNSLKPLQSKLYLPNPENRIKYGENFVIYNQLYASVKKLMALQSLK